MEVLEHSSNAARYFSSGDARAQQIDALLLSREEVGGHIADVASMAPWRRLENRVRIVYYWQGGGGRILACSSTTCMYRMPTAVVLLQTVVAT